MPDSNEVLATFYGDKSFPVEWESEEERQLFWFFDDNHVGLPISPMYWSSKWMVGSNAGLYVPALWFPAW